MVSPYIGCIERAKFLLETTDFDNVVFKGKWSKKLSGTDSGVFVCDESYTAHGIKFKCFNVYLSDDCMTKGMVFTVSESKKDAILSFNKNSLIKHIERLEGFVIGGSAVSEKVIQKSEVDVSRFDLLLSQTDLDGSGFTLNKQRKIYTNQFGAIIEVTKGCFDEKEKVYSLYLTEECYSKGVDVARGRTIAEVAANFNRQSISNFRNGLLN